MKKNNKTLSMVAIVTSILFALCGFANGSYKVPVLGWDLHPEQPIDISVDAGLFEERVDRGLFTHTDAFFVKSDATIGSAYDSPIVAGVEFVNGENENFFGGYAGIAGDNLYVGTRLGTNAADGDLTDIDIELNVGYFYNPDFYDVTLVADVNVVSGGGFDFAISAKRPIVSAFGVDVTGSVELGKTWEYTQDYEWVSGSINCVYALPTGANVFGGVSLIDNEVQTDGFESVFQIGLQHLF